MREIPAQQRHSGAAGGRTPAIVSVTDDTYCVRRHGNANVMFVVTSGSVVVIDTTDGIPAARAVLRELREITRLPVGTVVYSHHHDQQTCGARAFRGPETRIVAHRLLPEEVARVRLLRGFPEDEIRVGAPTRSNPGYVPPDLTFGLEYAFTEGEVDFQLLHAPGETVDHLIVWLPRQRVLFCGDLFQPGFPMLSSPADPDCLAAGWIQSLERMRELGARYVISSHGRPLAGAAEIAETLGNYAAAVRHIHEATVRCINAGRSVEDAIAEVQLPDDLAALPYLRQTHGKVAWAVRGIFRHYTGWYTFDPTDLNARSSRARNGLLLQICGGAAPILDRAQWALDLGEDQLVLELTDVVLSTNAEPRALRMRREALRHLSARSDNWFERSVYGGAHEVGGDEDMSSPERLA